MLGLIVVHTLAAIHGRWRRLTRRVNIGLNLALACLFVVFGVEGGVFESSEADQIARGVLALIGVVYLAGMCALVYGEIGRLDRIGGASEA